ncbi:rRNA maturation RNase YbeY [Portibacter marinus]|uniref:rRNA maturation RNase YbeY n=1 Tax=Portibacter marinus TaxID=2898660 RepID=UPI001F388323|nr:rRNA maturation RNase YbeY [Portibacter marinus]
MTESHSFPSVHFFYEETEFTLDNPAEFKQWIDVIMEHLGQEIEAINYIFCSDEYLLQVNRTYLNHEYYTDIISFPYSEAPNALEGDIFISVDRVKENAIDHDTTFEKELLRVMAHGLLHFVGYKDKTEEESGIMREKENEMINLFKLSES